MLSTINMPSPKQLGYTLGYLYLITASLATATKIDNDAMDSSNHLPGVDALAAAHLSPSDAIKKDQFNRQLILKRIRNPFPEVPEKESTNNQEEIAGVLVGEMHAKSKKERKMNTKRPKPTRKARPRRMPNPTRQKINLWNAIIQLKKSATKTTTTRQYHAQILLMEDVLVPRAKKNVKYILGTHIALRSAVTGRPKKPAMMTTGTPHTVQHIRMEVALVQKAKQNVVHVIVG